MQQINLTTNEAIVYITVINLALGILFGLIPLVLGFIKKERSYALFGFLGSIIGGAILGVFLSLPVAAIFTWLILRKPPVENNFPSAEAVNSRFSKSDSSDSNVS